MNKIPQASKRFKRIVLIAVCFLIYHDLRRPVKVSVPNQLGGSDGSRELLSSSSTKHGRCFDAQTSDGKRIAQVVCGDPLDGEASNNSNSTTDDKSHRDKEVEEDTRPTLAICIQGKTRATRALCRCVCDLSGRACEAMPSGRSVRHSPRRGHERGQRLHSASEKGFPDLRWAPL